MNPYIHPQCAEAIERLIKMKDPTFPDFVALKTYGNDKYSSMGWDELQQYINEKTVIVVDQFEDEANILSALRWLARGLPISLAIRKVRANHSIYRYKTPNRE
jgi:hypoxanthine-guanine phosphoribosyltransferase